MSEPNVEILTGDGATGGNGASGAMGWNPPIFKYHRHYFTGNPVKNFNTWTMTGEITNSKCTTIDATHTCNNNGIQSPSPTIPVNLSGALPEFRSFATTKGDGDVTTFAQSTGQFSV